MAELWIKQGVILRDYKVLQKLNMISMASILTMIVEDHKK